MSLFQKLQSAATSLILGIRSHRLPTLHHGGLWRVALGGLCEHGHRWKGAVHNADSFIPHIWPNVRPVEEEEIFL